MGELSRLVFTSRSALRAEEEAGGLADIIARARSRNGLAGMTSALVFHASTFAQVLEGPPPEVEAAFRRIQADTRHRDVRLLGCEAASARLFPGETMAFLARKPAHGTALDDLLAGAAAGTGGDAEGVAVRMRDLIRSQPAGPDAGTAGPRAELQALDETFATAVFSAQGRLVRASASYAALFGHAPEAILGRRRQELEEPREAAPGYDASWAALRLGERCTTHYQARRTDGVELWVRGSLRPFLDAAGQLHEVVEIAVDVSDAVRTRAEERGQIAAINASQAVVHLAVDGTILDANERFVAMAGYALEELVGRPHAMLVEPGQAAGAEYAAFWKALAEGRHQSGEFKRIGRDGREIWLQATYNPILAPNGRVAKIVKYATDTTLAKLRQADFQWQIAAIHKSHAVITFSMDGLVLDANPVFLDALGYALHEVAGRHHRLFVDPSYSHGAEYAEFWRELGRGRHQAGVYRRLDRDGREVWLQASYNPVFDLNGRPVKVVKYATVVTEEKLRQAEHQGQIAAIHKAQGVISFDLDGTILDANDNILDALGYRLSEVRGRHHRMLVEPEHAASPEYAAFWRALATGRHQAAEFKRIGRDGREVWLRATYNPIFDMSGRPFRVVKYATVVTEERLRQADLTGQIAAIHKSQGVISFAMDGTILEANDRFLEAVGYDRDALVGQHHNVLVTAAEAASAEYAGFWSTLRAGAFVSGLYRRLGRGGNDVWIQASYNPILDLNGRPFKVVKIATDVTSNVALSEAYEDAKRQSQHDPATSLPNRVQLASFMTRALASPERRVAVFYLDLDRFKPINDTHGHQVGDRVLAEVADRLRRTLSFGQLVARVGGDEFVVVATNLSGGEIEALAQRLIDVASAPVRCDAGELCVGASVGIAVSPGDATAPDELLRCADDALYRSKHAGRGTYSFFAAAMNERLQDYRNLVQDIERGLAEGQFFVAYQPRFDTRNRAIRSVEALVRWNHPERGQIAPAEFIPTAERSGQIVRLGEWVLRTACRDLLAWPSIGVSVNVSPVQFQEADVLQLVAEVLEETGLAAERLELEITEGVLLVDAERSRATLEGLKRVGVTLAIDDFGTGYSSLSSLRTFPFDVIKIDRQFITDMEAREGGREVVQAILGLGRALGMSVTAEGVETLQQLTMLASDDCCEVQGYLLAEPMGPGEISLLLDQAREARALAQG